MLTFSRIDKIEKDISGVFRVWVVLADSAYEESIILKFTEIPSQQKIKDMIVGIINNINSVRYTPSITWNNIMGQAAHDLLINKNISQLITQDGKIIVL